MTHRFESGGAVVFLEEFHALPLVSLVVALRTGAAHDPPGKEGLARIAMRMLRRGADGLDAKTVEDTIDRLGGEMAVDTGASSVAIHGQVIGRNVDGFVALLGRLLASPAFPEDEFERLKRETLAEITEAKDSDRTLAQQAFRRTLFVDHPYGRDATGTTESVRSLTLDDVRHFYKTSCVRENIVVGFSGDLNEKQARALTEALVRALPEGPAPAREVPQPVAPTGRHLVLVDKPERTQTQILIGGLGTWPHDPDHVPLTVATAIFGGTFTSRLMREIRSKRGWSYGASARVSIDRIRQSFSMWTFPAATDAAACIGVELELLDGLVKEGVTDEEVRFIQGFLTRSHAFEIDTAPKRLHQALDTELLDLPPDYYSGYVGKVGNVTATSATDAVKSRIPSRDLLVVVVGTAADILEAVKGVIPDLTSTTVIPFDQV